MEKVKKRKEVIIVKVKVQVKETIIDNIFKDKNRETDIF